MNRSRLRKILAVVLFNAVAVVVLLEVVMRLQEPYFRLMARGNRESPNRMIVTQYHPVWNHQVRPGLNDLHLRMSYDEGIDYTISSNSWGCRSSEPVMPKPEGLVRVIVLGDSFTLGYRLEDTVAARLEARLNAGPAGQRFEVINCASSSYSPLLIYLRLRDQLMEMDPDAVIVNVDQTDLYDDYWRYRPRMVVDSRGEPISVTKGSFRLIESTRVAMTWSAAVRTLVAGWRRASLALEASRQPRQREGGIPASTLENIYRFHSIDPRTPEWTAAFEFLASNVHRIVDLCAERGVHLAFTTYPHLGQIGGPDSPPEYHREFPQRLRERVESNGLTFYDAHDDIASAVDDPRTLYFSNDMHFNGDGQKVWSEAFARHLAPWVRSEATEAP